MTAVRSKVHKQSVENLSNPPNFGSGARKGVDIDSTMDFFGCLSNETVGSGAAGFEGLSFASAAKRWIQANRTPDIQVPDTLIDLLPFFCVLILVEMVVSFYKGQRVYYWRQSLSNLAAGALGFAILGIFAKGLLIFPYMAINNKYGLYQGDNLAGNVLCFLGLDLGYWFGHAIAHQTNLGWAGHSIHHFSPDFNLMTNFRQAPHELVVAWFFFLPLALFAPLHIYFWHHGINYFWQFILHTQIVPPLGPLELVFNTPTHHKIHHSRNYPSGNFGAVFIVWDRMFGTFVAEKPGRPCVFGLDARKVPLGTYNPLWQHVQHFYVSLRASVQMGSIKVLLNRDYGAGMIMPNKDAAKDDNPDMPEDGIPCDSDCTIMDVYVMSQAILCAIPTILIAMVASDRLPVWQTVFLALQGSVSTIVLCTSFNVHPTGLRNEILRLVFVAASFLWFFGIPYGCIPVGMCAVSGLAASVVFPKALQNAQKAVKEHIQ